MGPPRTPPSTCWHLRGTEHLHQSVTLSNLASGADSTTDNPNIQINAQKHENIDSGRKSKFSPKTQPGNISSILVCTLQVIKRLSTKQNPTLSECYAQTNRIV